MSAAVTESSDAFPVVWEQPADAERIWAWEASGCPFQLSPLSIDHAEAVFTGTERERGLRPNEQGRRVYPNGFVYEWRRPRVGPDALRNDAVVEERKRTYAAIATRLRDAWQRDFEPSIRRLCHAIRDRDYDAMSTAEIAEVLPQLFADSGSAFGLTMVVADGMLAAIRPFANFCKEVFGPSAGEALAGELVGGFANYTTQSELHIWRMARLAERSPALREAILRTPAAPTVAALRDVPGGTHLLAQLRAYLDLYGWRPEMWIELTLPLWAEDPAPLVRLIARYLEDPGADPRRARRRAAGRRRRLLGQLYAQLADAPERLAQFELLYLMARDYVPVRENRALWQLVATGVLRRPCLALGSKLCAIGLLDTADDVFYLHLDELQRLAKTSHVCVDVAVDHRTLIERRRADRARWLPVVPPLLIGAADSAAAHDLLASLGFDSDAPRIVRGMGASRGVARGRARVVRSMAESDTLGAGEVLVCRTTSPAWTPLIARAAAVVADAGGVLAHCAIVAREQAIPCVVGTGVGTQRIADGTLVIVDGTRGLVRLEHAAAVLADPMPRRARAVAQRAPGGERRDGAPRETGASSTEAWTRL
jgi:pyruvate,water dikinase